MLPLLLTSLFLTSCGSGKGSAPIQTQQAKTWTFLVYMDGDNNLSSYAIANFIQMQAATPSAKVNVVVQLATLGATTKRYQVKDGKAVLLADLGTELNMAEPQTITDFLSWSKTNYPADRTVLILWDHGSGWDELTPANAKAAATKRILGMFTNPGSNTPVLPNSKIREAIAQSGIKIDALGFDGCYMSGIEALYEFRGTADVLIASEETISVYGWDYASLLSWLAANPAMSVEDFGSMVVYTYRNFYEQFTPKQATLAAFRSSRLEPIAEEVDAIAQKLMTQLSSPATKTTALATIAQARSNAQVIDPNGTAFVYVDMLDLISRFGLTTTLPSLLSAATIAEYHGSARPNAHGISIVFFKLPDAVTYNVYDPNYKNYDPATDTGNQGAFINSFHWDEFLQTYYVAAGLL